MDFLLPDAIGNTPIVRLDNVIGNTSFKLFAKLEGLNPGGSIKDRPAINILKRGIEEGRINSSTVIIESSSGNMGIGLAQACAYFGLRFICVVDIKTTEQNIKIIEAYGAEVKIVRTPDPETGELLVARLKVVKELQSTYSNHFWTNQYENIYNSLAHHETMREIISALNDPIDYLFIVTSSCGTAKGCCDFVADHKLKTKIIGVDSYGSKIFGTTNETRIIPGIGAGFHPMNCPPESTFHKIIHVSNWDCVRGCWQLVRKEGILAGGSSGALISAVDKIKDNIPAGSTCVLILPDRGERYLDTIYSMPWVQKNFADKADEIKAIKKESVLIDIIK